MEIKWIILFQEVTLRLCLPQLPGSCSFIHLFSLIQDNVSLYCPAAALILLGLFLTPSTFISTPPPSLVYITLLIHLLNLFFHLALIFYSLFSILPSPAPSSLIYTPPTHTPVLWILEPHVPFSSSAPKFYPSSSIKHWKRHIQRFNYNNEASLPPFLWLLFMWPGFTPKWTLIGYYCNSLIHPSITHYN